jgi:hypothetical protein
MQDLGEQKNAFNEVFSDPALESDVYYAPDSKILKKFEKRGGAAYSDNLKKFLETQSLEDAFWAQSDLGKFERLIGKKQQAGTATPAQDVAADAARVMRKEINTMIQDAFKNSENPDLASKFNEAQQGYAKFKEKYPAKIEMDLRKYNEGKIGSDDVLKTLKKEVGREFRYQHGKQYPGIEAAKYPEVWKNFVSQFPGSKQAFKWLGREVKK